MTEGKGGVSEACAQKQKVRVGIVEDNAVLAESLARTLERSGQFELLGVALTLRAGLRLAAAKPDLLLIDLALPDGSGIDLIRQINSSCPACRLLVLSVLGDAGSVVSAIEAGADGYLLKAGEGELQTLGAIKAVLDGESPVSPAIARHILRRLRSDSLARPRQPAAVQGVALTARESEILQVLAKGMSFKEVAKVLSISPHTVTDHVKAIYKKLKVNSRAEAVFEGMHSGLIQVRNDAELR
jgi:DNA-binding NarL/FixJ family response regulator